MAKKETKKEKKRRLLLLILLLVFTIVLLSTSTYAWFTSNKTVSVDTIEVQARTANGLEISADAKNWGIIINKDNLITNEWDGNRNQLPNIMNHVSTGGYMHADGSDYYLRMFNGSVDTYCPDGTLGSTCAGAELKLSASEAAEGKCNDADCATNGKYFMAFDIFLKVTQDDTRLYLGSEAGVTEEQGNNHGIKNAVRIAFLVRGNIDSDTYYNSADGVDQARALNYEPTSATDRSQVYIWEPNYDTHTSYGVQSAITNFGIASTAFTGTTSGQLDYYGVVSPISQANAVALNATNASSYVERVIPQMSSAATHGEIDTGIDLQNGVTKIRVYFWVEGQDVDAENNATGYKMLLDLVFKIH